jgi:hypothetical protein
MNKPRLIKRKRGGVKKPTVCFAGCDGNLFKMISQCQISMKMGGFTESAIDDFVSEAIALVLFEKQSKFESLINDTFTVEK